MEYNTHPRHPANLQVLEEYTDTKLWVAQDGAHVDYGSVALVRGGLQDVPSVQLLALCWGPPLATKSGVWYSGVVPGVFAPLLLACRSLLLSGA